MKRTERSLWATLAKRVLITSIIAVPLLSPSTVVADNNVAMKARPLEVGSTAVDAKVKDISGAEQSLNAVLGGEKALIIFYRGGW